LIAAALYLSAWRRRGTGTRTLALGAMGLLAWSAVEWILPQLPSSIRPESYWPNLLLQLAAMFWTALVSYGLLTRRIGTVTETHPWEYIDDFGVMLGAAVVTFIAFSVTTQEPSGMASLALHAILVAMFVGLIHATLVLYAYWRRLGKLSDDVLSLPMGSAFARLPKRLTSRFGDYGEALGGDGDGELKERFAHLRRVLCHSLAERAAVIETRHAELREDLKRWKKIKSPLLGASPVERKELARLIDRKELYVICQEALEEDAKADEASTEDAPGLRASCLCLMSLLDDVWSKRGTQPAYGESPETPHESSIEPRHEHSSPMDLPHSTVDLAEAYVALELVRFTNRLFDLLWARVTLLTVLTLLLMATVNSYPFQPAGTLGSWTLVVLGLALAIILSVLIGYNRSGLVAQVNGLPANRSLWNLDFLGKATAYVGPVLALLAALSIGASDFLRIILGPLGK
jgi:hypothetical protein